MVWKYSCIDLTTAPHVFQFQNTRVDQFICDESLVNQCVILYLFFFQGTRSVGSLGEWTYKRFSRSHRLQREISHVPIRHGDRINAGSSCGGAAFG